MGDALIRDADLLFRPAAGERVIAGLQKADLALSVAAQSDAPNSAVAGLTDCRCRVQ